MVLFHTICPASQVHVQVYCLVWPWSSPRCGGGSQCHNRIAKSALAAHGNANLWHDGMVILSRVMLLPDLWICYLILLTHNVFCVKIGIDHGCWRELAPLMQQKVGICTIIFCKGLVIIYSFYWAYFGLVHVCLLVLKLTTYTVPDNGFPEGNDGRQHVDKECSLIIRTRGLTSKVGKTDDWFQRAVMP